MKVKFRELKASTKAGQQIISRGEHWEGDNLYSVYEKPSEAKQKAFDRCWNLFCEMVNSEMFGICSHNTHSFSVSWYAEFEQEPVMVVITRDNNYMVFLNR
jgi:hypothetical protein